jgi:hypothetical protein
MDAPQILTQHQPNRHGESGTNKSTSVTNSHGLSFLDLAFATIPLFTVHLAGTLSKSGHVESVFHTFAHR